MSSRGHLGDLRNSKLGLDKIGMGGISYSKDSISDSID
jgi:hypothetical protein